MREMPPTLPIDDLRAFLAGAWRLARVIDDRRAGVKGRFGGEAVFAPEGETLDYREQGVLRFAGWSGVAEQHYGYRFVDRARAVAAFCDGRPFHMLDLSSGRWETTHLCAADRYLGSFRVRDHNTWTMRWIVTGPRKDQTIVSRFRRHAAPASR